MILKITGRDNKTLKFVKSLKRKSVRTKERQFVAEGKKIVLEALKYVPELVRLVVITEDFAKKEQMCVKMAESVCDRVLEVSDSAFLDISDTDTPQGILAVLEMPDKEFAAHKNSQDIIVLDGVSEPGNMGTIIRTAEALGFDGIYLMKGCTDIFSSKTVRSTMGSVFRMKFKTECTLCDIEKLKDMGFSVISTTPVGDTVLEKMDIPKKAAVVIGNEAHGVCDEVLKLSDFKVKITMDGLAESLNAAIAAGIAMHWIKNSCTNRIKDF